jgi:hypothetical protein
MVLTKWILEGIFLGVKFGYVSNAHGITLTGKIQTVHYISPTLTIAFEQKRH